MTLLKTVTYESKLLDFQNGLALFLKFITGHTKKSSVFYEALFSIKQSPIKPSGVNRFRTDRGSLL